MDTSVVGINVVLGSALAVSQIAVAWKIYDWFMAGDMVDFASSGYDEEW